MKSSSLDCEFRRVEVPARFLTRQNQSQVIKADWLAAAQRRHSDIEAAERKADDILAEARMHAESLLQSAENEYAQRLESIEREAASQLERVAQYLGDAVAMSVESIYRSIFNSDPTTLMKATTEIARHVLEQEVACTIHVNINDRDDESVTALEKHFTVHTSHQVASGELHIRSDNGEIKVDARKLIRDLGQDLRHCFRQVAHTVNT